MKNCTVSHRCFLRAMQQNIAKKCCCNVQQNRIDLQRSLMKVKLVTLFAEKYTEDVLEKTFHSLQTSILREVKKLDNGIIPKRTWKFFDEMEFLKSDLNKKKTVQFEIDEIERLIDFYR